MEGDKMGVLALVLLVLPECPDDKIFVEMLTATSKVYKKNP